MCISVNTTYKRIWDDADRQWKYSKSFYQVQFLFPRAVLPSPMRILYYLVKHIHSCKRKQQTRHQKTERNKQAEIFRSYKQTLVEILTVKLTSDYENTIQEDFEDLRQDIRNHITEKQKINEKTVSEQFRNLKETIAEQKESELENYKILREEIRKKQGDIDGLKEELKDIKDLLKTLLNEKGN